MIIQEWRFRRADIKIYGVILALSILVTGWGTFYYADADFRGIFLIIFVVWIGYETAHSITEKDHMYMIVGVETKTAVQVVENTLRNKNIPFSTVENNFFIDDESIKIQIGRMRLGAKNFFVKGTKSVISIGPMNKENEQLVQSLQKRIQNSFHLTGLSE